MAVTTDVGDANDIHPTRKEPVGQRLALAARALAYGEKIEYSGPLYQSMQDSPLRHSAQTSIDAGSASHAILPVTGLLGFRAESEHPLPPKGGRCSSQDRTKALAHARLPASFQR